MKHVISAIVIAAVVLGTAPVRAQERADTKQAAARQVALRVQLVVSRHQGEKKVSSLPYTLSVVANDGDKTSMRMGVDVPIPQTVISGGEGKAVPMASYNYRSIGTNIDCAARTIEEGIYKLDLAVEDSSIFIREKDTNPSGVPNVPAPTVRRFTSSFNVLLRDGQTIQHTAATDPVSGEVLRIDVTLTVLK